MRYQQHVLHVFEANVSGSTGKAAQMLTTALVLAFMLWLGARAYSAGANATLEPAEEDLCPGAELAWSSSGESEQASIGLGNVKVNVEAYNKKREKDIAEASRKLLSLAIDLKSDLEQNSDSGPSPNALSKAKQIEKLAHDVKENMKLNIIEPQ